MVFLNTNSGSGGGGSGGTSGVNQSVTSWTELAAIATAALSIPQVIVWVNAADDSFHVTQLRAGTDATDTAAGIQRPDDYNDPANTRCWYDT